jgi:hypothetical protein
MREALTWFKKVAKSLRIATAKVCDDVSRLIARIVIYNDYLPGGTVR